MPIMHVVFISSPIVELVAYLYFKRNLIHADDVFLITTRNYECRLLDAKYKVNISNYYMEKIFNKVLGLSFESLLLSVLVFIKGLNFNLYSAWDLPQTFFLKRSRRCKKHFYLEEGQLSHNDYGDYEYSPKIGDESRRISRWRKGHINDILNTKVSFDGYFSSTASGFIRVHPKAFGNKPTYKLDTLEIVSDENMEKLVRFRGVKNIGVFPAPRRIVGKSLPGIVDSFLCQLGSNSLIKLHPGYQVNRDLKERIINCVRDRSQGCVAVSDDAIIELEMLVEKKVLYGPVSSLQLYAELMGSRVENLDV